MGSQAKALLKICKQSVCWLRVWLQPVGGPKRMLAPKRAQ